MSEGAEPSAATGDLVGRDRELSALAEVLERLRAGRGGVVMLDGAPGTGKSSLLELLVREAQESGIEPLTATAVELDGEMPLAVARRALGPALDARGVERLAGTGPAAALEHGLASVHAYADAAAHHARADGPAMIAIDDLHWADRQTDRLLVHLAELTRELPALVALAWRRGELDTGDLARLRAVRGALHLELSDLDAEAAGALVLHRLPAAEPEFVDACRRATGGNPFLLRELVDSIAQAGTTPDAGAASRIEGVAPASVTQGVLMRLGRLPAAATALARAVAVLGDGTPLRHAARLARVDADAAAAAADTLVAVHILRDDETLAFRHPLLAAAVLDDLGGFTRARWYRRAADVVAAEGLVGRAGAHLLRAEAGGDPRAAELLHAAGATAFARGDARAAARLLSRALAEPPPADDRATLLLELSRAEAAVGEPAAIEHLDAALDFIDDPLARAEALRDLARMHYMRLDLGRAGRLAERAMAELDPDDPRRERIRATWVVATGMNPDTHEGSVAVTSDYAAAAEAGTPPADPELRAIVAVHLSNHYGAPDLVASLAESAVSEETATSTDGLPLATELALAALLYCDRLGAVERAAGHALTLAEERRSMMAASGAAAARGLARLQRGDVSGAAQDADLALIPSRYGWLATAGQASLLSAQVALARDDVDQARAAIAVASDLDAPHPPHRHTTGLVELASGNPEAALEALCSAGELWSSIWGVDSPAVAPWRSMAALAALALDRGEQAERLAREELELAERTGIGTVRARAARVLGLVRGGERGLELLQQAVELADAGENVLEQLRARVDLGGALRRAGERREAREVLAPARATAEKHGFAALARQAAQEQRASGARLRRVAVDGVAGLTPSERRIAELAAAGLTNREIAAQLFLTLKTVEWHLSHVFGKLEIRGRRELPVALGGGDEPGDGETSQSLSPDAERSGIAR